MNVQCEVQRHGHISCVKNYYNTLRWTFLQGANETTSIIALKSLYLCSGRRVATPLRSSTEVSEGANAHNSAIVLSERMKLHPSILNHGHCSRIYFLSCTSLRLQFSLPPRLAKHRRDWSVTFYWNTINAPGLDNHSFQPFQTSVKDT